MGLIQQQAIAEVMALPKQDTRRSAIVKLLATWKVSIEVSSQIDAEERELVMNLSQAYLEWEQQTELRGVERGKEQERREIVENLLLARFGVLDSQLAAIVQPILNLPATEYAALLLQFSSLSREDLLARFG
ncbi:hypothetical protein [Iningainema tapete]|nr:hypothetical protein [Iningainema tapete]